MRVFVRQYYPEISWALISLAGGFCSWAGPLTQGHESLANFSSFATLVLSTYVGLMLTAYTVFHAMRINSQEYIQERMANKTDQERQNYQKSLDSLHRTFVQSAIYVSAATLFAALIYFLCLVGKDNEFFVFSDTAIQINGFVASVIFGGIVSSTLNVLAAIHTLFSLRGL